MDKDNNNTTKKIEDYLEPITQDTILNSSKKMTTILVNRKIIIGIPKSPKK
jgi:hypothetical protein